MNAATHVPHDMIANNLTPAYPTHPGEVVRDEIEFLEISQKTLAGIIDVPYKVLNDVLNARRPLSAEMALKLEAALDIPAATLLGLQTKYNLYNVSQDSRLSELLQRIRRIAATL